MSIVQNDSDRGVAEEGCGGEGGDHTREEREREEPKELSLTT